jgi:hypothetical protein
MIKDAVALLVLLLMLAWHYYGSISEPQNAELNIDGVSLGMERHDAEVALGEPLPIAAPGKWNDLQRTHILFDADGRVRAIRGSDLGLGGWHLLQAGDSFTKMVDRLGPYESYNLEDSRGSYHYKPVVEEKSPPRLLEITTYPLPSPGDVRSGRIDEFTLLRL